MKVTQEIIKAREVVGNPLVHTHSELSWAVQVLDNAGVFAPIDDETGYGSKSEDRTPNGLDPAEWGDQAYGPRSRRF